MSALTLYDFERSGNCYKVRLLLAMLGEPYQKVRIDVIAGETDSPVLRRLNPRGQVPVLVDGEQVIWDSMAILVYLARRAGAVDWLPDEAFGQAQVMQWLAVAENELQYGLARARSIFVLGRPFDLETCHRDAHAGLAALEHRLGEADWLALDRPTLADLACYPYVALADQAKLSLTPYPAVQAWIARLEALPGWEPMLPA